MTNSNQTSAGIEKKRDRDAMVAFWLAFFIMIWPVEADLLALLLSTGHVALFYLLATLFFLLVFSPWFRAVRRHRREPGIWSGRGYLIATGVILAINLLAVGAVTFEWLRNRTAP